MAVLVALFATAVALQSTAPPRDWNLRLARRGELWAVASLLQDAFAQPGVDRSLIEVLATQARLALDVEKRLTPWNWARHRQLVAESNDDGRLIGAHLHMPANRQLDQRVRTARRVQKQPERKKRRGA